MKGNMVVFDVDGTLFDTKGGIIKTLNFILAEAGMDVIEKTKEDSFIGPPIKESLITHFDLSEEMAYQLTKRYREVYVSRFIGESAMYNHAIMLLKKLRENGCILGVATLKTKTQVEKLLGIYALGEYFDIVAAASESGNVKKTDMLKQIRLKYINEVRKFYMIGDTQGDWKAAVENEYEFIAADYGYGDIEALPCTHICSIDEVLSVMQQGDR